MKPWASVAGWDPGTKGALVILLLDDRGQVQSRESVRFSRSTPSDIVALLTEFRPDFTVLEQVTSYGMGRGSAFKFGTSYGFARGALLATGCRFDLVRPQKWQAPFSVPRSEGMQRKRELKAIAQRINPGIPIVLEDADAHLIAEMARRYYLDRTRGAG